MTAKDNRLFLEAGFWRVRTGSPWRDLPPSFGASAVIPPKSIRKHQREFDAEVYEWRHLVENYFAKIKHFKGMATWYEKPDFSYAANRNLVAALIASR